MLLAGSVHLEASKEDFFMGLREVPGLINRDTHVPGSGDPC